MQATFSLTQQSIINGSLLGDGSITKRRTPGGNCYFTKPQSASRKEYLEWHFGQLEPFSSRLWECDNSCKGKKYRRAVFATVSDPLFTSLRDKWYPDGVKVVPRDLELDPLSLAIWYFDDGSDHLSDRCCRLATYGFARDDCEFLVSLLDVLGLKCYIDKANVIRTHARSYKDFVDLVRPFMLWPCFAHKIRYRDSELEFTTDDEARQMFEMYEGGSKQKEIAEVMHKSISVVSAILRGERMHHLGISKAGSLALNNSSGIKGVSWDKTRNKWKAFVRINGKTKNLGRFLSKEEAYAAVQSHTPECLEKAIEQIICKFEPTNTGA